MSYGQIDMYGEYEQVNGAVCNQVMREVNRIESQLSVAHEKLRIAWRDFKDLEIVNEKLQKQLKGE